MAEMQHRPSNFHVRNIHALDDGQPEYAHKQAGKRDAGDG